MSELLTKYEVTQGHQFRFMLRNIILKHQNVNILLCFKHRVLTFSIFSLTLIHVLDGSKTAHIFLVNKNQKKTVRLDVASP